MLEEGCSFAVSRILSAADVADVVDDDEEEEEGESK